MARNIEYRRDLLEWDGITLFTDSYIFSEIPDRVRTNHKIGWLLEPPSISPWLYDNFESVVGRFDFTLTYEQSLLDRFPEKTRFFPCGGCWIQAENMGMCPKSRDVSMIYSSKTGTAGHRLRHEFARRLKDVDLFGRGIAPIEHKEEGLLDYRYSIVVENERIRNYFTEKLVDCLAVGTIPIYWGCPNIGDFFDDRGVLSFESPGELQAILAMATPQKYAELAAVVEDNFAESLQYEITEDWFAEHVFPKLA
ncbi:MAG: glycosyltransferase family 10 domain-containing protein [Thermoanaerobaculia bacterium]